MIEVMLSVLPALVLSSFIDGIPASILTVVGMILIVGGLAAIIFKEEHENNSVGIILLVLGLVTVIMGILMLVNIGDFDNNSDIIIIENDIEVIQPEYVPETEPEPEPEVIYEGKGFIIREKDGSVIVEEVAP